MPTHAEGRRQGAAPTGVQPAGRQAVPLRVRRGLEGRRSRTGTGVGTADAEGKTGPVVDASGRGGDRARPGGEGTLGPTAELRAVLFRRRPGGCRRTPQVRP